MAFPEKPNDELHKTNLLPENETCNCKHAELLKKERKKRKESN